MPTYPVLLPSGARVRLSAPQWRTLRTIVTQLARRPHLVTWLPLDLFPARTNQAAAARRTLPPLASKGVLERIQTGYRLAAGVAEQVQAAAHAQA